VVRSVLKLGSAERGVAYDAPGERWVLKLGPVREVCSLKLVVGYDRGMRYDAPGERCCESECANDGIGPRTGAREVCASEVVLLLADVMASVDVEVRRDEPSAETSASAPDVSPSSSSSTDWSEEVDGRRSPSTLRALPLPLSLLGLPRWLGSMLGRVLRRLSTSSHSLSENAWSSDGNHDRSTLVSVPTSRRSSTATQSSQFSRRGCLAEALRLSGRVEGP
jgi:hypothetical protein